MCTNYTDLNKACPKDVYHPLSIDRLFDGASKFWVLSFLDVEKMTIITEDVNFCYRFMPFGLKNTGATYQ